MTCFTRSTACRTAATAAVLLLGAAAGIPYAGAAGIAGTATSAEAVTSATWGTTATVTAMTFTSNAPQTSDVVNSGTVDLTAESFVVTVSRPVRGRPRFRLLGCSVPWVGTRCPNRSQVRVGGNLRSNSTTTVTAAAPLAVGAVEYLLVSPSKVIRPTSVTISTQVAAPGQVRAPVSTNQ